MTLDPFASHEGDGGRWDWYKKSPTLYRYLHILHSVINVHASFGRENRSRCRHDWDGGGG